MIIQPPESRQEYIIELQSTKLHSFLQHSFSYYLLFNFEAHMLETPTYRELTEL